VRPYLKTLSQKRAGGVAHGVGPEFKPQYHKKKGKKKIFKERGDEGDGGRETERDPVHT
jgi:hypothetical protein